MRAIRSSSSNIQVWLTLECSIVRTTTAQAAGNSMPNDQDPSKEHVSRSSGVMIEAFRARSTMLINRVLPAALLGSIYTSNLRKTPPKPHKSQILTLQDTESPGLIPKPYLDSTRQHVQQLGCPSRCPRRPGRGYVRFHVLVVSKTLAERRDGRYERS